MKWSCHLVAMPELVATYPDAQFVITHRYRVRALASTCSTAATLQRATAEQVDPSQVGRQMKDVIRAYLEGLVASHESVDDEGRSANVEFKRVIEVPEMVMSEICRQLGRDYSPVTRNSIAVWRNDNPPGKRGTHSYSLDDYGLGARAVAEDHSFYIDRFDVPVQAATR